MCVTVYATRMPTTRYEHVQHQFDKAGKVYTSKIYNSPSVLGLRHCLFVIFFFFFFFFFSKTPVARLAHTPISDSPINVWAPYKYVFSPLFRAIMGQGHFRQFCGFVVSPCSLAVLVFASRARTPELYCKNYTVLIHETLLRCGEH